MRSKIVHDTGLDEVAGGFTFVISLLQRHQVRRVESGCSLLVFQGSVLGQPLLRRLFNMRRVYSVLLCLAYVDRSSSRFNTALLATFPFVLRYS